MQHLEVSGAVRHIYVVRQLRVNIILSSSPLSSKWSPSFCFFHRSCQRISIGTKHMYPFCKKPRFYGEELLAPCPNPKLGDHSLSTVRDCLFNILAATLQRPFLNPKPKNTPCRRDSDSVIMGIVVKMMVLCRPVVKMSL